MNVEQHITMRESKTYLIQQKSLKQITTKKLRIHTNPCKFRERTMHGASQWKNKRVEYVI